MESPMSLTFSDQEIQEELSRLGYNNIPQDKLREFQQDLNKLVEAERSKLASKDNSFAARSNADSTGQHEDCQTRGLDTSESNSPRYHLRKEDLDEHDHQHVRFRQQQAVPGSYALFELPQSRLHDDALRDDVSETDSEIRRMKRKTLRKNDAGAKFIDESMSDVDTGSIIETHERMERMVLRDLDCVSRRRAQSARSHHDPPPYRLDPDDPRPSSVIYPMMDHPHTKNLRRADPVMRYQQFQQAWAAQQAPGEKQRKGLRWNIREQMLTQFVPEKKPQRKYVANTYVPPPEKKRSALRWQIRMDMAQGTLPVSH